MDNMNCGQGIIFNLDKLARICRAMIEKSNTSLLGASHGSMSPPLDTREAQKGTDTEKKTVKKEKLAPLDDFMGLTSARGLDVIQSKGSIGNTVPVMYPPLDIREAQRGTDTENKSVKKEKIVPPKDFIDLEILTSTRGLDVYRSKGSIENVNSAVVYPPIDTRESQIGTETEMEKKAKKEKFVPTKDFKDLTSTRRLISYVALSKGSIENTVPVRYPPLDIREAQRGTDKENKIVKKEKIVPPKDCIDLEILTNCTRGLDVSRSKDSTENVNNAVVYPPLDTRESQKGTETEMEFKEKKEKFVPTKDFKDLTSTRGSDVILSKGSIENTVPVMYPPLDIREAQRGTDTEKKNVKKEKIVPSKDFIDLAILTNCTRGLDVSRSKGSIENVNNNAAIYPPLDTREPQKGTETEMKKEKENFCPPKDSIDLTSSRSLDAILPRGNIENTVPVMYSPLDTREAQRGTDTEKKTQKEKEKFVSPKDFIDLTILTGTRGLDVLSQRSIENTAVMYPPLGIDHYTREAQKGTDTEKEKKEFKKEKFVPPKGFIDLTSTRGLDVIPFKGSTENTAVIYPLLDTKDPSEKGMSYESDTEKEKEKEKKEKFILPVEFIDLTSSSSEDESEDSSPAAVSGPEPTTFIDGDPDDPLAAVWDRMARAIIASKAAPQLIPTWAVGKSHVTPTVKPRKMNNNAVVGHTVSFKHPSVQLGEEVNELEQVKTILALRAEEARSRKRHMYSKDPGPSQLKCWRNEESQKKRRKKDVEELTEDEMDIETESRSNENPSNKAKRKEVDQPWSQEDGGAYDQNLLLQGTEKKQRKEDGDIDALMEDWVEDETECRTSKKTTKEKASDKAKGRGIYQTWNQEGPRAQKKQKLNAGKEKRPRKKDEEEFMEDEIDEEDEGEYGQVRKSTKGDADTGEQLISQLNVNEEVNYEPYVWRDQKEDEDKDNSDEEELEDLFNQAEIERACTLGPVPDLMGPHAQRHPQSCCESRDLQYSDEVGRFCNNCGRVYRDIQRLFLLIENQKAPRTQANKVPETMGPVTANFQLTQQNFSRAKHDVQPAAELQLHTYFEERLHPHQKKGFKFLSENLWKGGRLSHESVGCVLAHAPGTGKTCLVISFIQSFLSSYPEGRPLILAPKIMLPSWEKEFKTWKVQVRVHKISKGTRDLIIPGNEEDEEGDAKLTTLANKTVKECRAQVLQEWHQGKTVLLMSYTMFAILVSNGLEKACPPGSIDDQISKHLLGGPNLVILDEGHLARNEKTKLSQALIAMETKRRVLLSGTLFQNNFKELYTLLKLCRDDFMSGHPQYGKKIAKSAVNGHGPKYNSGVSGFEKKSKKELMQIEERMFKEEIGDRLESYVKSGEIRTDEIEPVVMKLQSLTASLVDWYPGEILKSLPGLFEYSIHLNLTSFQLHAIAHLPTLTQLKNNHMSRQCKLLAACIHPSLVDSGDNTPESNVGAFSLEREAYKGVKMTFLLHLVALCQIAREKLLIFCSTLAPLNYIEALFLQKWKWQKGEQIVRLDGTMQDSDRQIVIRRFNSRKDKSQVLLASTKACKEGISLVGASRVVIIDNPDNPSVVRQAVSRAFRIGQKKKVFVYRLVTTNKDEEYIFRRSVNKERLSQVLLDPVSTMARLDGFLQSQSVVDVEDELLRKMMLHDRDNGRCINEVKRYNASG